jgi:aminoglycoside phosphotransferase (APT) family kinase protein
MFDLDQHSAQCEKYLSRSLGSPVELLGVNMLPQSTRAAPWRLDVKVNDTQRAFVLQIDPRGMEYEYQVLKAMETLPIPTPHVYGLDLKGEFLGTPCFFSDYIFGDPLLSPLLAGEAWAVELYLDTVFALHSIKRSDLGEAASSVEQETAKELLENNYAYFKEKPYPLADRIFGELMATLPDFPPVRFSNGDLWLENFIVQDKHLAGVIDFQNAAFSDPIYEFLLSFFVSPELQGRGIEERFCERLGYDPAILHWYHGLEFFETWRWTSFSGKSFVHHTASSMEAELIKWLG